MYHEKQKYEVLFDKWVKARSRELQNMNKSEKREFFKDPKSFVLEMFEDVENLLEWKALG